MNVLLHGGKFMLGVLKQNIKKQLYTKGKFVFEKRNENKDELVLLLDGYKPFLYDAVISRMEQFVPDDMEICIVSSGLYDERLSKRAKDNNWSYLSVKRNCVSLAQNIAIKPQ